MLDEAFAVYLMAFEHARAFVEKNQNDSSFNIFIVCKINCRFSSTSIFMTFHVTTAIVMRRLFCIKHSCYASLLIV